MKRLNFIKMLVVVTAVIASTAVDCEPWREEEAFTIQNNSSDIIYYYIPEKYEGLPANKSEGLPKEKPYMQSIDAKSSGIVYDYQVDDRYGVDELLPIYIFTARTMCNYTWETIVSDRMYECILKVSVDDVLSNDHTVYYPPKK